MTEALRPVGGVLPRLRGERERSTADAPPRATTGSRITGARQPYHLATFLGASAGVYAVTLAAVTGLQAATERQTAELRAPAVAAAERLKTEHDALDRRLAAIRTSLEGRGGAYDELAAAMAAYGDGLAGLATSVGDLEGQAASLPTRLSLPSAPRIGAATRPKAVATTGASGKP